MEEHFKNKLKNHKVDWDKEALLSNLQKELSPNKSRFNKKWFLLLPLLLLATCWGWNNLQIPADNTTVLSVENNAIFNKKDNNSVKEMPINQKAIDFETNQSSSVKINQPNKIDTASIPDSREKNTQPNLNPSTSNFTNLSKKRLSISDEQPINDLNKIDTKVAEHPQHVTDFQPVNSSLNTITSNKEKVKMDIVPLAPISWLKLNPLDLMGEREKFPTLNTPNINQKKDTLSSKNPFYLSGSGAVGFFYRNRKFNSDNTEFVNRLEENEATEKSLITITSSLYFGYQTASKWSLQTGLEYQEIKEVFDYNKSTSETLRIPKEEPRYFVVENMDTTFVLDTVNVLRTEERVVKNFNTHKFYSIPIQIGYGLDLKKVRLVTRLGLSYTFAHKYQGKTNQIYPDGGSEILANHPEFRFELKNRIGFQAGLALEYPFGKYTQVFAMATYRRSPKLVLGVIEQRYHSLSIGAGVKFSLGSNK